MVGEKLRNVDDAARGRDVVQTTPNAIGNDFEQR